MANGSPNGRRRMPVGRAVDLSAAKVRAGMTEEEARAVQEKLEHELGWRCNGCGRRITVGVKFTSLAPRDAEPMKRLYACTREDCDFAERCRDGGTVMELFEVAWLDMSGKDAPASLWVTRRNEQMAREAEADANEPPDG